MGPGCRGQAGHPNVAGHEGAGDEDVSFLLPNMEQLSYDPVIRERLIDPEVRIPFADVLRRFSGKCVNMMEPMGDQLAGDGMIEHDVADSQLGFLAGNKPAYIAVPNEREHAAALRRKVDTSVLLNHMGQE